MGLFGCDHHWVTTGLIYQEPLGPSIAHASESLLKMRQFGATTVTQRCEVCGRVDTYQLVGRVKGASNG